MPNFLQNSLQNIASALGLNEPPGDWRSRLREEITLTAPDGTVFTAHWRGSARTITNKINVKTFPGIIGAKIQKFGTGEEIFDLSIIFGGPQNDLNVAAFMTTFKKTSTMEKDWEVEHPTKGPLFGVFVKMTENDFPVESGNMTIVTCPFIINLPDTKEDTAAQAQAQAEFQAGQLNDTASGQFFDTSKLKTPDEIQAVISATRKGVTAVRNTLSIISGTDVLPAEINSIIAGIENTLTQDTIDTLSLSRQVQELVQIFGLGQEAATTAVKMYGDFVNEFIEEKPTQPTSAGVNEVAVTELFVTAALVGSGQAALIGGITSRQEALTIVEALTTVFNTVSDGLDTTQELYNDNPISNRYFSQSQSYADALMMTDNAQRFILIGLFGLPAERRIILRENKFLHQIAFDEYGSIGNPGAADYVVEMANVILIHESNNLHGDRLYWLPAGTEVLIQQAVG